MLGRLRATNEERELTRFRTTKAAALFAYLAYYPREPHAREKLIDWLWPDNSLDAGRNGLSTALSHLRNPLEPPGVAPGTVLRADRATIQLNPDSIHTDVGDFKAALQKAEKPPSEEARIEALLQALGMYQGTLLPGLYDDWVLQERQHLAALFERAANQLIAHFKATAQPDRAIVCASRVVAVGPVNEEAHCELMRLYSAQGQYAAALRQYHLLEHHLARLLDEKPSPTARALAEEIEKKKRRQGEEKTEERNREYGNIGIANREETQSAIGNRQLAIGSSLIPHPLSLPAHVVLLLTDIERSTLQWIAGGERYADVLTQHHALLRDVFRRHGGLEVKEAGDGFIVVFENIADALACAVQAQHALVERAWPNGANPPRVRMALHTGHVQWDNGDARGLAMHHVARLAGAAHGGQILCSEATFMMASGANDLETAVRLNPLGVYRLRDFPDAQTLYQVCWPDMPQSNFPPPNALPGHADNLPQSATRFVGRKRELAQLETLLSPLDSGRNSLPCRLLTLTGMGGTGKTRLALEIARRRITPMEGAVWQVPLVDAVDARGMADAMRQHLRLPSTSGADLLNQLTELFSRRPSLLVLDNFEQLLPAPDNEKPENEKTGNEEEEGGRNGKESAGSRESVPDAATLVGELLERVPTLTVLVTSRHLLRLAQEREFVVPPMQIPDAIPPVSPVQQNAYLARLNECESVRLFVERAQDVRADFQLTMNNAPAITRLCARLEGIPLAIELAAARAQVLTPAQMLAQLNDRFAFLVSRYRNITPRQRSLRASLDLSYALLSPSLQKFLAQLSIFRGGWTWEAAAAICQWAEQEKGESKKEEEHTAFNPPDVLDYLAELRDSSLVVAEEHGEQVRFRLLETLREYADEQLSSEEREGLRQAHYSYYLDLAQQAEPELTGPRQVEWLDRLESEHDNFRAALRGAVDAETRLRLGGALYRFWERRDHFQEGRFWLEAADDAVSIDAAVQAKALNGAGVLALSQGDYDVAQRMLEHSLAVYEITGDLYGIGQAHNNIGNVLRIQGNYTDAKGYYETSLQTWERYGDISNMARVLSNLGITARSQGDMASAKQHLEASLQLCERIGDEMQAATVLINLGRLADTQGQYAQAQDCYLRSLELFRKLGRKASIALALLNLGSVVLECQGCAAAWPLLAESLLLLQEVADRGNIPFVLELMAEAMIRLKRRECATLLLGASTSLREMYQVPLPVSEWAQSEQNLTELQRQLGAQAFEVAWNKGKAMNREQAIEYACLQTVN